MASPDVLVFTLSVRSSTGDGVPLDSAYVEKFWLPVLGPTATCLLRQLGRQLREHARLEAKHIDVATSIGVRGDTLDRAIKRLATFGWLDPDGGRGCWQVIHSAPPVPARLIDECFSPPLRQAHAELLGAA